MSIFTSGNHVEALIDGASYFRKLYDSINASRGGDSVCLSGWRLDYNQELIPGNPATTVENVLGDAHRRGVDLRVLLSDHLTQKNSSAYRGLKRIGVQCILDSRHPSLGSSHQKLVTGQVPPILESGGGLLRGRPIARSNIGPARQYFPVIGYFDLDTRQCQPHRIEAGVFQSVTGNNW